MPKGYAWEITTAEGGWGLDGVLQDRQHVLNGIANGIDMAEWNPETDEHTPASYSVDDLSGMTLLALPAQVPPTRQGFMEHPDRVSYASSAISVIAIKQVEKNMCMVWYGQRPLGVKICFSRQSKLRGSLT